MYILKTIVVIDEKPMDSADAGAALMMKKKKDFFMVDKSKLPMYNKSVCEIKPYKKIHGSRYVSKFI